MGKTRRFFSKFIKPKLPFFFHKSKSSSTNSFRIPEEVKEEEEEEEVEEVLKEIPTSNFPTSISKEACFKAEAIQEEVEEDGSELGKSSSSSVSEFFSCTSSVSDDFLSCSSFHELSNIEADNNSCNSVSSVSEYFSFTSLEEVGSKQQLNCIVDGEVSLSQRFFFLPSTSKSIIENNNEKSVTMAGVCSDDPYWDFRSSIEAMVEAHTLRDHWPHLLELLSCYMKLNEKRNHRIILIAFMDLILQLTSQDS